MVGEGVVCSNNILICTSRQLSELAEILGKYFLEK